MARKMNSRNERRRMYAGDGKTSVITKSHRTTACSAESLGARSVPSLDRSSSPECEPNCERVGTDSSMAATLTDEPLFESRGRKFEHTLAIIKPEAARLMYKVEAIFARKGFIVIAKNVLRLSREQVAEFYGRHSLEPYFPRLVNHVASGPVVVYVLSKRDGVTEWRRLIGPADVSVAKTEFPSSLRAIYGTESRAGPVANAFHGSDSPVAARREIRFFFPGSHTTIGTNDEDDNERFVYEVMVPKIKIGLSEMLKNYPTDPLRWFGKWLLNNKEQQS